MASMQLAVGQQQNPDSATLVTARGGKQGDVIVSELHGRYYEQTYRKNLFSAAALAQTTSVGLALTYVGLCLSNPLGSPVNLVLTKIGYAFTVVFAAASTIGLMVGSNLAGGVTHTTPVVPKNNFIGGPAGYGLADSAASLNATPTVQMILTAGLTGAITTAPTGPPDLLDVEGSLIVTPGAYVAFYTSTASGAAGANFSMQWEEVPV